VHPPYSLIGVQAAFTLGGDMRRRELLHFAIMRKACPDLAKMPFANEGWSEAVTSSLPDAHEFQGPPVCYDGSELQPEQWKPQRLLDNLDVARELLLDETSSPIHDIVDRGAVERVLADPERATPRDLPSALRCSHGGRLARGVRGATANRRQAEAG
jgi:hypothetical protein